MICTFFICIFFALHGPFRDTVSGIYRGSLAPETLLKHNFSWDKDFGKHSTEKSAFSVRILPLLLEKPQIFLRCRGFFPTACFTESLRIPPQIHAEITCAQKNGISEIFRVCRAEVPSGRVIPHALRSFLVPLSTANPNEHFPKFALSGVCGSESAPLPRSDLWG